MRATKINGEEKMRKSLKNQRWVEYPCKQKIKFENETSIAHRLLRYMQDTASCICATSSIPPALATTARVSSYLLVSDERAQKSRYFVEVICSIFFLQLLLPSSHSFPFCFKIFTNNQKFFLLSLCSFIVLLLKEMT